MTSTGVQSAEDIARVPLIWPARIARPPTRPALAYLDLNHFIYLARVAAGLSAPLGYVELLGACRSAFARGHAIFPLSGTHYIEMSGIADPAQRKDVARMMEELSDFHVLLGRATVAQLEIEAMLDTRLGQSTQGEIFPLLGRSCLWAFGLRGGIRISDEQGRDRSQRLRTELGETGYDELMARMHREGERMLLAGPADSDVPRLRAHGYQPEVAHGIAEQRARQEREQAGRLDADPRWRRSRLRDVVGARELSLELFEPASSALLGRGLTWSGIAQNRDSIREFADGMPSCRVSITLKTRYHRNPNHRWLVNDIHDIDALSVAVAYCDAVFTDKAAWSNLRTSAELTPLGTYLPRKPADLSTWLSQLGGSQPTPPPPR